MSSVLMGQALPPNDMVTVTEVEHAIMACQFIWNCGRRGVYVRKAKKPCMFLTGCAFGTAAQMAETSSEGPPISVVPVSMAAKESSVLPRDMLLPFTVTATKTQKKSIVSFVSGEIYIETHQLLVIARRYSAE